jgi:hypothetical protein
MKARFDISETIEKGNFNEKFKKIYESSGFTFDILMRYCYIECEIDVIFNKNDSVCIDSEFYIISEKWYDLTNKTYKYILDLDA